MAARPPITDLYRAVDNQGRTVDFLRTAKRDVAAAKRFFQKAMNANGAPRVITLDAYAAAHRAARELVLSDFRCERKSGKFAPFLHQILCGFVS